VQFRAELLSHFMLRKIPNSIVDDEDHPDNDLFARKRESVKYEETRASVKLMTSAATVSAAQSYESQPDTKDTPAHTTPPRVHHDSGDFEPDEAEVVNTEVGVFQANTTTKVSQRRAPQANEPALALYEMFCGDKYMFQSYGLSRKDSTSAHGCIVRSGCTSFQELLMYLDDNKQARLQGVCNCAAPDKDHDTHDVDCGSRVAAMWTDGLTNIGIPVFCAVKIVRAVKKDLK